MEKPLCPVISMGLFKIRRQGFVTPPAPVATTEEAHNRKMAEKLRRQERNEATISNMMHSEANK